jgi:DNA invertase Pin-like site-specific DNA recombinase
MRLAYSYIRFSTPEQERGDSFRRQSDKATAWAEKNNYRIVDTIYDRGISGYRGTNVLKGRLGAFLALVEAGEVAPGSVLIFESLDRFSRNTVREVLPDFLNLINAGIGVVTLTDERLYTKESLDADNLQLLVSLIVMTRAHEESQTKGKRVAEAWAEKRKQARAQPGIKLTDRIPLWLTARRDRHGRRIFAKKAKRVKVVRRIFEETAAGIGRRTIIRRLNSQGILAFRPPKKGSEDSPQKSHKGWQPSSLAKLIASRAVLGEYQPHKRDENGKRKPDGDAIKNYYPAIIEEALWTKANRAIAAHRAGAASGQPHAEAANLLRGICYCACGERMLFINKGPPPKGGRYYVCGDAARKVKCKRTRLWNWGVVDNAILHQVAPKDLLKISAAEIQQTAPTARDYEKQLSRLRKMEKRAIDIMLENDDLGKNPGLRARADELRIEIANVEKRRNAAARTERTKPDLTAAALALTELTDLRSQLQEATDEQQIELRRKIIRHLRTAFAQIRFSDHEIYGLIALPGKPASMTGPFGIPLPIEVKTVGDEEKYYLRHRICSDDPEYCASLAEDGEAPPKRVINSRHSGGV